MANAIPLNFVFKEIALAISNPCGVLKIYPFRLSEII